MEKTKLIYHTNSYTYECTARVVAVEGDAIALDATVFYPGGGGQMADRGSISWGNGDYEGNVIALSKRNDVIWHVLDCSPPAVGTEVVGTIDWMFRYKMMRTHTALHILCGTIWKEFGVQVTGGQMYPDRARMDFAIDNLDKERIAYIETKINEAVEADYPIRVYTLPREKAFAIPDLVRTKINLLPPMIEEVRIVEIVGLDLQADGGTHVNHTKEVGHIYITKAENKGRINKRLEIVLGEG
ncbi:misacylated tRNA(Ala) deacylase [Thermosporothrix hazakensis]|jgi:misacylated tRNA(Ala) deacylase|uniref:Misacylated tRNA(Ala) deacylase n=2 Tax=Thermosporothrix TaxID=768650 RepID=A0A326UCN7_THEHA|nr:alanyl-tRNA editing protein [Thermosporothrix hazakensis]PZW32049.1 misacylated tRNA(Ala) deacylase [Thermosporothrix hazakensis]BBH91478.1 alanyl-tRNA editing protein AlaX [Thermosporothrix sp. COM3]GCE49623.1 alanyl-tRNA editing protein AlaX [Thermosporothrix hazakensis]